MPTEVTGNFDITFKTEKAFKTFGKEWAKCNASLGAIGNIQNPDPKDESTYQVTFTMACQCESVLKNFKIAYNKTFNNLEMVALENGSGDSIDDTDFTATLNACGLPRELLDARTLGTGVKYSVKFTNNSLQDGDVCLFQQQPGATPYLKSLAWFAKRVAQNTTTIFTWSIDYCFVWAQTGELVPGVTFLAGQVMAADLSVTNETTLLYKQKAYRFTKPVQGTSGSLTIHQDNSVPSNDASIGIGMSGFGTFAIQAQPNMTAVFTPHPEYWIVFGNFTQGDVMDIENITNAAQITFTPPAQAMSATLQANNTWDIKETSKANALLVAAL